MQMGLVGLGKMGFNMRERLREGGHEVIGYDPGRRSPMCRWLPWPTRSPRHARVGDGAFRAGHPRPVTALAGELSPGDLVIDGGNSRYTEDGPHAKLLGDKGIAFIDAGVSGGIWG